MVSYFVVLNAIFLGMVFGNEMSEMVKVPDITLGNATSQHTVILNSLDEAEARLEQDELDLEKESTIDTEMILRDLDMSLYEYEQEILDDIN